MADLGAGEQPLNLRGTRSSHPCLEPVFSGRQTEVAETLNVPSNRVSCHVRRIGGAFGGKVTKTSILACITSVAAWK